MKKTFICIALLALLVSCNGNSKTIDIPISKTHCSYTFSTPYFDYDPRTYENIVIEHIDEEVLFIVNESTDLIDLDYAKEYIGEFVEKAYLFAEIEGIEVNVDDEEYDDDYQKLIYYMRIDVKNLDFEALNKLENKLNTGLIIDVYKNYTLGDYITSMEEEGWECKR